MKRMKSLKGSALTVLFGMAVLCTVMFAACPNAAKGGGKSGPAYVKVPYDKLDGYLANTASADKINYIEITGEVPKEWFTGKVVSGGIVEAGELGKKIQAAAPKKVALKLPGKVEGLDSMFACFFGCTNLVSLAGIPASVKDMSDCFNGCTSLTESPVIPASVTDMSWCFGGCTSLTKAPFIPANVTDMRGCFEYCTSLTKAPDIPESVTYMAFCFEDCTRLTKAPVIPESVTNMEGCFRNCTSLTQGPVIPAKVTDMEGCFYGCTSLTESPVIPESVTNMERCFEGCTALKGVKLNCPYNGTGNAFENAFLGCTSLEAGGIKVKNEHYDAYTNPAALDKMKVPGDDEAAKKAKFSKF